MNEPITTQPTDPTGPLPPPPAVASAPKAPALPAVTVIGDPAPKFHSFFEEYEGGFSMGRLLQFLFFVPFFICVFVGFFWRGCTFPEIPQAYLVFAGSLLSYNGLCKWVETRGGVDQARTGGNP